MESFFDFYTTTRLGPLALNVAVYVALLVACWAYALRRGAAPERIGATILAVISFLTAAAISGPATFNSVEVRGLIVDLVGVVAFLLLALRAERFWPFWVAAFQIIGTAGHGVKFADPDIIRPVYAHILAIWSYPMILLLVIGTRRHQKRLSRFGSDESWSPRRGVS